MGGGAGRREAGWGVEIKKARIPDGEARTEEGGRGVWEVERGVGRLCGAWRPKSVASPRLRFCSGSVRLGFGSVRARFG